MQATATVGLAADEEVLATPFSLHLHRGIGYLCADRRIQRVGGLFQRLPAARS